MWYLRRNNLSKEGFSSFSFSCGCLKCEKHSPVFSLLKLCSISDCFVSLKAFVNRLKVSLGRLILIWNGGTKGKIWSQMVLLYECGGYDRITQNSWTMTIRAKNFGDTVSWFDIIATNSYCNLTSVRHTWELKLTFLKFPSFMPEWSLKCEYIRMMFLLILSCKRFSFFWWQVLI